MKLNPLLPIFLVVFVDLLGVGIVIPVLAPMFLSNSLLPAAFSFGQRTFLLGLLIASYPLAQFFGSPLLGALSDRHGRKPVLIVSLAGTLLGYLLFAVGILTKNLPLLFASRMLDGATGGNISTALSAIADISDKGSRAKNFGLVGMAFGLGFIIGPYLGGKLSDPQVLSWFNFATPFLFAAILCVINIIWISIGFRETIKQRVHTRLNILTGPLNVARAFSIPSLRSIFIGVFLMTFGFVFFTQFFQVYLIERFHFTQSQIGDVFAYMGLWIAITQGFVTRAIAKRLGPNEVLKITPLLLALTLPLLLIPGSWHVLLFVLPLVALFNGVTQPNITAAVSNRSSAESQGEILGISQSVSAFAQAIPPIIAGLIVSLHPSLPIIGGSLAIGLAWLVFAFGVKPEKQLFKEV